MPSADVTVVGAGLAGLTTGLHLAERGARVVVLAKGHASTHWTAGTLDVAAPPGAATPRAGIQALADLPQHPYAFLREDVEPAVDAFLGVVGRNGLPYAGGLDSPIRPAPTGIGGLRPVAIVPDGQAAALQPWGADEWLVVCGFAGFKDFWPEAVAASLARPGQWASPADPRDLGPASVAAANARLPGLEERHNLTGLHLARAFDDPPWRRTADDRIARAVDRVGGGGTRRVGLPAVLGLSDHAAVLELLRDRLGVPVFELPLVPPSIPGIRLFDALRAALRAAGGRIQLGESVSRVEVSDDAVRLVATPAAVREFAIRTGSLVIATGGIAGGGIVGRQDGRLEEAVLGLPVEAAGREVWFADDALDPIGHPIEAAGVRTDAELRPVDPEGRPTHTNVRVAGSTLAGQRWLRERCGDGVALASAWRAAARFAPSGVTPNGRFLATADTTSSQARAPGGPIEAGIGPVDVLVDRR